MTISTSIDAAVWRIDLRRISNAFLVTTRLRYLTQKTKWACNWDTECRLRRYFFLSGILTTSDYGVLTNISIMKISQSYRFRIYPTKDQEEAFRQISGCCRLVYNLGFEQRRDHWRRYRAQCGRSITNVSQINELPELKREFPFLKDVPSHCLQQALKDLDKAYQNFFNGIASYPRPRRKVDGDSFRFPDPKQFGLTKSWLHVPKFGRKKGDHGRIRMTRHRKVKGDIKTITIIRDGQHWYASLSTVRQIKDPARRKAVASVVGVDRGVINPIALSDGGLLGQQTETPETRKRIKRLQQSVARKKKGSSNRSRAIQRLSAFKALQARRRKDQLHKISCSLVKNHDVIVLEDLKIRNMTGSARGTADAPGSMVSQKAGLNREILDRGWGMFGEMLAYKADWSGKRVLRVPAHHSSQTCIACGHVSPQNRKSQDRFCCTSCGHAAHADIHAAQEIRRRGIEILNAEGLSVSACGEFCASTSAKQEEIPALPGARSENPSSRQSAA